MRTLSLDFSTRSQERTLAGADRSAEERPPGRRQQFDRQGDCECHLECGLRSRDEDVNQRSKRHRPPGSIFPNDEAIVRLVGTILLEQNDEWAVQRARYMTLETMAALSDDPVVGLPAMVI
jgi:hypothetical protein